MMSATIARASDVAGPPKRPARTRAHSRLVRFHAQPPMIVARTRPPTAHASALRRSNLSMNVAATSPEMAADAV
jgi:hypothetical protein